MKNLREKRISSNEKRRKQTKIVEQKRKLPNLEKKTKKSFNKRMKRILVIGVNGISMRSIAYILKNKYTIYGYDDSAERLEGVRYTNQIPEKTDLIVYSSSIKETHPIRKAAEKMNIKCLNRTDFFIKHMPLNEKIILIAGAHGKTTTASLIAYLLENSSYYIGGIIQGEETSAHFNEREKYTIIETDESDASFIKWKGHYKILLNFDYEHMIFYKTKEKIEEAHRQFVLQDINETKVIIDKKAKEYLKIPNHPNIITFSHEKASYQYSNIECTKHGIKFKLNEKTYKIPVFGEHNAHNFTSIIALFDQIQESTHKIQTFPGVKKRMQKIFFPNHQNISLFSHKNEKKTQTKKLIPKCSSFQNNKFFLDYGHHPEEIDSTLKSLTKHFPNEKFQVLFEPHKPSRILENLNRWPEIFKNYTLYLYELFIADEKEINDEKLHFSTEIFFNYLKEHNINVKLANDDLSNIPTNTSMICFSAGKLSDMLQKFKI